MYISHIHVYGYGTVVINKALCFDVAQGRLNGAPNENRTHSCIWLWYS